VQKLGRDLPLLHVCIRQDVRHQAPIVGQIYIMFCEMLAEPLVRNERGLITFVSLGNSMQ
jgi:hypothetical protein